MNQEQAIPFGDTFHRGFAPLGAHKVRCHPWGKSDYFPPDPLIRIGIYLNSDALKNSNRK